MVVPWDSGGKPARGCGVGIPVRLTSATTRGAARIRYPARRLRPFTAKWLDKRPSS